MPSLMLRYCENFGRDKITNEMIARKVNIILFFYSLCTFIYAQSIIDDSVSSRLTDARFRDRRVFLLINYSNIIMMANEQGATPSWKELTSEDKKYVEEHMNETDEARENAISKIKRWIEESDDLRIRIDDFFILRFLRVCKFNLENTKIRMQKYYKQRSDLPEWYMNKDALLPELQELLNMGICLPLRKPDDQGRLVLLIRITSHDPRKHKISDLIKVTLMVAEIAIKYYPAASVYGCVLFQDVIDSTLRHVAQYRPSILMNVACAYQNYPLRIRSINIFNMPELFKIIIYIMKTFMNEKMRNRIHTYSHKTMQNCFKDIPANILPIEYGGTDGTIQELIEFWKKQVEENRDWILNEENYKVVISEQ